MYFKYVYIVIKAIVCVSDTHVYMSLLLEEEEI